MRHSCITMQSNAFFCDFFCLTHTTFTMSFGLSCVEVCTKLQIRTKKISTVTPEQTKISIRKFRFFFFSFCCKPPLSKIYHTFVDMNILSSFLFIALCLLLVGWGESTTSAPTSQPTQARTFDSVVYDLNDEEELQHVWLEIGFTFLNDQDWLQITTKESTLNPLNDTDVGVFILSLIHI